jgi:hypothetical protein
MGVLDSLLRLPTHFAVHATDYALWRTVQFAHVCSATTNGRCVPCFEKKRATMHFGNSLQMQSGQNPLATGWINLGLYALKKQ